MRILMPDFIDSLSPDFARNFNPNFNFITLIWMTTIFETFIKDFANIFWIMYKFRNLSSEIKN